MAEHKIQFMFNTPFTGVIRETGKFDEETHKALALPLRGRLMQIDGVSGCYIARFGFYVEYFDEMTDRDAVVTAVEALVAEYNEKLVESGYFPLRGEKTPGASPKTAKKWRYNKVTTGIDSLTGYTTVDGDPNEFDAAWFNSRVRPLVEKLGNANGVTKVEITMTSLGVTFDSRVTNFTEIKNHVKYTLAQVREQYGFFPHVAEGAELKFTFENWNIPTAGGEEV